MVPGHCGQRTKRPSWPPKDVGVGGNVCGLAPEGGAESGGRKLPGRESDARRRPCALRQRRIAPKGVEGQAVVVADYVLRDCLVQRYSLPKAANGSNWQDV